MTRGVPDPPDSFISMLDVDCKQSVTIPDDVRRALKAALQLKPNPRIQVLPHLIFQHKRLLIHGMQYATHHVAKRDSFVFFQLLDNNQLVPGLIRHIFAVEYTTPTHVSPAYEFFLVIHRFLPAAVTIPDPLKQYPDFRAGLWSNEHDVNPIVIPASTRLCHAAMRPWNSRTNVIKALDRVSWP